MVSLFLKLILTDWDVDKSVQNQYKWTVDWEDDLEEDNFMTELRAEIKKH